MGEISLNSGSLADALALSRGPEQDRKLTQENP
jgi:hypothetical protein